MTSALKEKLEQAKEATTLAIKPSVLSIFQDEGLKRQLAVGIPEGSGLTVSRLLLVAFNEIRRNPELGDCTRDSFVGALLQAARLGLEIGGPLGHFHLVPFKNTRLGGVKEVTPILGYKGMIVLARRSRELSTIGARPWFANDIFEFSYGLEDSLVHRPKMDGARGDIVGFYGVARFVNGGVQPLVMSKPEVDAYRKRSRAAQSDYSPWTTDYEAMGAKTIIRRMSPFLPLTVEAATAIAEDEEREEGRTPEMANLDLSDFGVADGAGEAGAGKPKGKPASTPASPASNVAEKPEPPERDSGITQLSGASVGAEGAGSAKGNVAEGPAPSATPVVCGICGAVEDPEGHMTHDEDKHAEVAKQKRDAKKQQAEGLFDKPGGAS